MLATGTRFVFVCDLGGGTQYGVKITQDGTQWKLEGTGQTYQPLAIDNANSCTIADLIFEAYKAGLWKI